MRGIVRDLKPSLSAKCISSQIGRENQQENGNFADKLGLQLFDNAKCLENGELISALYMQCIIEYVLVLRVNYSLKN